MLVKVPLSLSLLSLSLSAPATTSTSLSHPRTVDLNNLTPNVTAKKIKDASQNGETVEKRKEDSAFQLLAFPKNQLKLLSLSFDSAAQFLYYS